MENKEWSVRGKRFMRICKGLREKGGSIIDVSSAGRSSERAFIFTIYGMSMVNQCIVIIVIVLITVLQLHHILERIRNSLYYCVPPTIEWSNGLRKWAT